MTPDDPMDAPHSDRPASPDEPTTPLPPYLAHRQPPAAEVPPAEGPAADAPATETPTANTAAATPAEANREFEPTAPLPHAPAPAPAAHPTPEPPTRTLAGPGWLLPGVAAIALVIGLLGGAVGGVIAARNVAKAGPTPTTTSGGTVTLPERTAAPLPADNESVPSVAAKVLPSTVQIVAEYQGEVNGATGSGWVFDSNGHIVTNNHVVEAAAKDGGPIKIIDNEGNHYAAKVVGRSQVYDLAVLEAPEAKALTPMALGSSKQMRVGETVVAIGSPLGLSASVTSGIISAVDRPVTTGDGGDSNSYINAVQTDAAINPGNSGGPLVNLQGQVIGVNSAIASMGNSMTSDQAGNIGVGFAIPVEQVLTTANQIIATGKADYPVIGAGVKGTTSLDGAELTKIEPGMPADKAGLKAGDIVRKIDGKPITGSIDLVVAIRSHVAGDQVTLTIDRGGKTQEVKVGLDAKTG